MKFDQDRPSKHEAFLAFLEDGWVQVHLDARAEGVSMPPQFSESPHLVLQYGHEMPIPIEDLQVDDFGIAATLSFARQPHKTRIPWTAIYVIATTEGRGILYNEDVPKEVTLFSNDSDNVDASADAALGASKNSQDASADEILTQIKKARKESVSGTKKAKASQILRSVPLGPDDETPVVAQERKKPRLRLVK